MAGEIQYKPLVYNACLGLASGLLPAFIPSTIKNEQQQRYCKTTYGVQRLSHDSIQISYLQLPRQLSAFPSPNDTYVWNTFVRH